MESTNSSSFFYSSFVREAKEPLKEYNEYYSRPENNSKEIIKEDPLFFACNYYFHSIPIIGIEDNELIINYDCGKIMENGKSKLSEVKNFLFLKKDLDINCIIKCKIEPHKGEKYKYYCKNCNKHLCEKCFSKCPHSKNKKIIFDFEREYYKTSKLKKEIQNKIKEVEKINPNLKILIESICRSFEKYPHHYSYFINIKVIHSYLSKIKIIN